MSQANPSDFSLSGKKYHTRSNSSKYSTNKTDLEKNIIEKGNKKHEKEEEDNDFNDINNKEKRKDGIIKSNLISNKSKSTIISNNSNNTTTLELQIDQEDENDELGNVAITYTLNLQTPNFKSRPQSIKVKQEDYIVAWIPIDTDPDEFATLGGTIDETTDKLIDMDEEMLTYSVNIGFIFPVKDLLDLKSDIENKTKIKKDKDHNNDDDHNDGDNQYIDAIDNPLLRIEKGKIIKLNTKNSQSSFGNSTPVLYLEKEDSRDSANNSSSSGFKIRAVAIDG